MGSTLNGPIDIAPTKYSMDINELESFKMSDAVKFHKELNPNLWINNRLDPEVRDQLILIAEDFITSLGLSDLQVADITISGSNAAYSYTPHSDLDLHVLVDMSQLSNDEIYRELFTAKKTLYNDSHDITVHGVPVELYVQDVNEPVKSLGEYSVLHDEWIHIPKKKRANYDEAATKAKFENLAEIVELALKTKELDRVEKTIDTIKRYRKAGLAKGGEFGPENLAFKAIRKQGGIQDLYDLRNKLRSEKLSIEEASSRDDAILKIKKLMNTAGRTDSEIENINRIVDKMMRQWNVDPREVGLPQKLAAPVIPTATKAVNPNISKARAAYTKHMNPIPQSKLGPGIFAEGDLLDKPEMTVAEIAKKHDVPRMQIAQQLDKGIKVELEHTSHRAVAREIALNHLEEDPKYYDKLASVELEEMQLDETAQESQLINLISKKAASVIYKMFRKNESKLMQILGPDMKRQKLEIWGIDAEKLGVPYVNDPVLSKVLDRARFRVANYVDPINRRRIASYHPDTHEITVHFPAIVRDAPRLGYEAEQLLSKTIAHELQHAVDYLKSKGKAFKTSKTSYYTLPYEINARFQEALMNMSMEFDRARQEGKTLPREHLPAFIDSAFEHNEISQYLPKNGSRYKQLAKRAFKFFDAELNNPKQEKPLNLAKRAMNFILDKPTKEIHEDNLMELADKPYPYREVKKTDNSWKYHFETEDGNDYLVTVVIGPSRRRSATLGIRYGIEIHFELEQDGHTFDNIVNTGDAVRVFSTVANILLDAVKRVKPDTITILSKADEPSRVKLYSSLANRALKLLPEYEFHHRETNTAPNGEEYVSIDLAKKGVQSIKLGGSAIKESIAYHVTPTKNLRSIMKNGLRPQIGDRSSQLAGEESGVFVFPTLSDVEAAVSSWLGDEFDEDEELSLLAIDVSGLPVSDSEAGYEKIVKTEITPDRISLSNELMLEASGYIPSAREKNDPRFKTALTVDVKPDAIKKNAKAFNWKTSRAGIPPQARADGKIAESLMNEWIAFLAEDGQQGELFPGYDKEHREKRLDTWLGQTWGWDGTKPKVFYHATTKDFDTFNTHGTGFSSVLGMSFDVERHGSFFAVDPKFAEEFIEDPNRPGQYKEGGRVIPVYLSIQNPIDLRDNALSRMLGDEETVEAFKENDIDLWSVYRFMDEFERWEVFDGPEGAHFVDVLQKLGFDGAIIVERVMGDAQSGEVWVAFNPNQVKAIHNRGSFSPDDPSLMRESINEGRSEDLFNQYGGRMMEFDQLPASAKKAIEYHMTIEGDRPNFADELMFGYVNIPMNVLTKAVMSAPDNDFDEYEGDFGAYHSDYWRSEKDSNYANHLKEMWPVILDDDEGIHDGWHRLHWYYRNGVKMVPAILLVEKD